MHPDINPEEFRDRLSKARGQETARFEQYRDRARHIPMDETGDEADSATAEMLTSSEQQLAGTSYERIESIEDAMERLDLGTYGECMDCGDPIDIERLRVQPDAALCVACADLRDKSREHHQNRTL